jgi:Cof subfamily protein (haloacid dehalogenase superfamily)
MPNNSPPRNIRFIVSDIDGTLLNSQHQLSPANEAALRAAMAAGVQLILATGKTRTSAVPLIAHLGLTTPGVYNQGVAVYDGAGELLYSRILQRRLCEQVVALAQAHGCSMVGYVGGALVTDVRDEYTDVFIRYHEPTAVAYGTWQAVMDSHPLHKFIMVSTPERIKQLRPAMEAAIGQEVTIVQALPNMIELLPLGASKGDGVRRLMAHLGAPLSQVMALGDGENDAEMLRLAGWGVAMGNAMPAAKEAADAITGTNDEEGVAQAIYRYVLAD